MMANEPLGATPISTTASPRESVFPGAQATVSASVGKTQMLSVCVIPGCGRLTMGGTCVEHDSPVSIVFPRGRPYVLPAEPVTV